MRLLHLCANTLIEYQENFVLALAFVRKSLYRTRRFHSLWASATHTKQAIMPIAAQTVAAPGTEGEFCMANVVM